MRSIDWWYFQWHGVTPTRFSRSRHSWSRISQKRCILGTNLQKNTNRKPYTMIPLSMILSDLWPHFKVTTFLKSNIVKTARLKDKLLLHNRNIWNGTMFVDLDWPLNSSSPLSASAVLLVFITATDAQHAANKTRPGRPSRLRDYAAGSRVWLAQVGLFAYCSNWACTTGPMTKRLCPLDLIFHE